MVWNITINRTEHVCSPLNSTGVLVLVSASFLGRVLVGRKPSVDLVWTIQNIVHVSELNSPTSIWRDRPFLVLFECHVVVVDSFGEVASLVFTGPSCVGCVNVVRVNLQDCCKVLYTLINLA